VFRIFEKKTVRKIFVPMKDECLGIWQTRRRWCKIYKIPLRCYGHIEGMPQENATATMEGTRKSGSPSKRWWDKVEDGLYIMGIKTSK
jgi:hypothetical protein